MVEEDRMGQRGRPPKEEQLETQKTLQWYFERGITATVTSQRTGKNINTVCKYFEEFYEQISEFEKVEFLERQKKERERIIITFDSQILDTYESLDDIESEINKYKQEKKPIPRHLISLKLETMKYISILTEKKGSFVMLPSMDDATKKKIEEWVKENAKAG